MSKKIIKRLFQSDDIKIIWTNSQAIECDQYTVSKLGIEAKLLMENAGKAVADEVVTLLKKIKHHVLLFVGPGNNGADTIVTARHLLAQGVNLHLYLVKEEKKCNSMVQEQLTLLKKVIQQISAQDPNDIIKCLEDHPLVIPQKSHSVVIIDGIFGTGLNRAPCSFAHDAINIINDYKKTHPDNCTVLSVDVPSGLTLEANAPMGDCVRADYTITFGQLKRVHISEPTAILCGKSKSHDIGLFMKDEPNNFFIFRQRALKSLFLPMPINSHKGQFGHVMVFEGHDRYLGASRLSARGAMRAGAGLVTIITKENSSVNLNDPPEFMHCQENEITTSLLKKIDALVIGPGLSNERLQQERALTFLNNLKDMIKLIVIDADALKLLQNNHLDLNEKYIVATPHAKEAAGLLNCTVDDVEHDRFMAIESLSKIKVGENNHLIWVLKGATTLVRDPLGLIFAFKGSLPILATAGSGDILSGTIAGLYKQTPCPLAATLLAISLQIESAKRLSKKISKGTFASEIANLFPILTKR